MGLGFLLIITTLGGAYISFRAPSEKELLDGFAEAQRFSPALMEGYLRAASRVAALAVGDRNAVSSEALYRVPKTTSQRARVEGAPWGTRGGLSEVARNVERMSSDSPKRHRP